MRDIPISRFTLSAALFLSAGLALCAYPFLLSFLGSGPLMTLSLLLLLCGTVIFGAVPKSGWLRWLFVSCFTVFVLLAAFYAISDYITENGINEAVMFSLQYGFSKSGFGDFYPLIAVTCLSLAAFALFVYLVEFRKIASRLLSPGTWFAGAALLLIGAALNPAPHNMYDHVRVRMLLRADAGSSSQAHMHDFYSAYRTPEIAGRPRARKNIVYIYAESLERTYLDESLFPGLLPGIRSLEAEGLSFTDIEQSHAAWWTMGGAVASQCGLPLIVPSGGNAGGSGTFLPGARCLGDMLKDEGYTLAHTLGTTLDFAGEGSFYFSHGFSEVQGLEELRGDAASPEYVSSWGLYDDTILAASYKKFEELSSSGKPFGLFLSTLDTHYPAGHISGANAGSKYGDGRNPMLNAVHVADRQITAFIRKIQTGKYGANTVIVLASDHLAMRSTASYLLARGRRRNLFLVLDGGGLRGEVSRPGTTFDVGPTLLHLLGYRATLGLGRDLLEEDSVVYARSRSEGKFPLEWMIGANRFWRPRSAK